MSLAAKKVSASLPVNDFDRAYILFQIIIYECSGITEQIFMLTPHISANINHRKYILVGASVRNAKIQPLHPSQIERGLHLIGERLKKGTLNDSGIQLNDIMETVAQYRSIDVDTLPDGNIALPLSRKISVLMNKVKPEPEYLDFLVNLGDIQARPKSIEFVGYTSGDDLLRVRVNSDEINKNPARVHLLDDVRLDVDKGAGFNLEYNGEIIEFSVVDSNYVFEINRHYMFDMKNSLMKFMAIKGINPQNIFYYMSRNLGIRPENIKIQEYDNRKTQTYMVVVPIHYLKIEGCSEIGKVEFYEPLKESQETKLIKSIINSNVEIWDSVARGKINVQADNPYDAYIEGREQIELALSILMHLARSDTIRQGYSVSNKAVDWNRKELQPKPKLSTWVYIYNASTGEHLVHSTEDVAEIHVYTLDKRMKSIIKDLEWYETLQCRLNSSDCTKKEREIIKATYDSLNWLRRSWDAETPEEQIIYSNMAMEFIVNTEGSKHVIPKDLNNNVLSGALSAFQDKFDGTVEETAKYVKNLEEKLIWALGDVPVMVKVDNLINRLDIPIREQDFVLLKEMRKRRNDIIHGRPMRDFSKVELWKLNQVLATLAAYKLRSLIRASDERL